jgi:[lysine-biosynthesis-protein LysW]--L-2-aminoadipate ligase
VLAGTASETNVDIVRSWRRLGLDASVLTPAQGLAFLRPGDVALGRLDVRRTLDGVEPGLLELAELRRRGVRVLNTPAALLRAHDKLRTARALAAAGVGHPPAEHITATRPLPALAPPVVIKPRFGSWGADVLRCDTAEEVRAAVQAIAGRPWFRRQGALVQALVPPVGYDLRVLVAGGEVVGAESRIAATDDWRTNISLGGTSCAAIVPPRAHAISIAAAAAVDADFVGVDLLPDGRDYVVIEVNGSVDFEARYALPGRDVFIDIAHALAIAEDADAVAASLAAAEAARL